MLDEIEAIVYSGTKLNIDYFLNDVMDEDHMLDIYDYFKESTTDKIDDAMDELGADYTEEEIRLVRIKFISELAKLIVAHFNFNRGSKQSVSLLPRFVIFISSFSESVL